MLISGGGGGSGAHHIKFDVNSFPVSSFSSSTCLDRNLWTFPTDGFWFENVWWRAGFFFGVPILVELVELVVGRAVA